MLTEVISSEQLRMYLGNCYRSLLFFMIYAIVVRLYIVKFSCQIFLYFDMSRPSRFFHAHYFQFLSSVSFPLGPTSPFTPRGPGVPATPFSPLTPSRPSRPGNPLCPFMPLRPGRPDDPCRHVLEFGITIIGGQRNKHFVLVCQCKVLLLNVDSGDNAQLPNETFAVRFMGWYLGVGYRPIYLLTIIRPPLPNLLAHPKPLTNLNNPRAYNRDVMVYH